MIKLSVFFATFMVSIASVYAEETVVRLVPHQETVLSAAMEGRIITLPFKEGEAFKKGDLLLGFDCIYEKSQLEKAQAVSKAANKKHQVVAGLKKFKTTTDLEIELAALEAAKAKADEKMMIATVRKCSLHAPFDGKVSTLDVQPHQFATPGTKLMRIIDDTALNVEFFASSHLTPYLNVGQEFTLHIVETGTQHQSRIIRLGADIDPVSHSIKVVATIIGEKQGLMAGMSGQISLLKAKP